MAIIASSDLLWPCATMTDSEKRTLNDKFILRMPDGMRDEIRRRAEANKRSMNSEILAYIEAGLWRPVVVGATMENAQIGAALGEVQSAIKALEIALREVQAKAGGRSPSR